MNIEEMNHINFDWYAPKNAFRQSPEEVRSWCKKLNLNIEHEYIDEAGITHNRTKEKVKMCGITGILDISGSRVSKRILKK